jgi:hypothetical protein
MPLRSVVATRTTLSIMVLMAEDLLASNRTDCAYLRIVYTEFGGIVEDWMDVQGGVVRLSGQLTQTMDESLLQIVCEVVLGSEEDNSAFRD